MMDRRGIILNVGIATFMGLLLVGLALVAWALNGYDIRVGALWDWSWALFALGALLLTARAVGMNLWALILMPVGAALLWYFGVMGGTI